MRKILQFCQLPHWVINKLAPYTFNQAKQAIIKNDFEFLSTIMQVQPNFNQDENVLMFALREGKQQIVLFLIEKFSQTLHFRRRNDKGDSPLMIAIFRKKKETIKALIPFSQVNACDFYKNTAFIAAAANGDIDTLEQLIDHPENNSHAKNNDGQTALHRASFFGQIETIDWLLDKTELKIGELDKNGNNGLHLACYGAQIATTRYLMTRVKHSINLLLANHEGKTPKEILQKTLSKLGYQNLNKLRLDHLNLPKGYEKIGKV